MMNLQIRRLDQKRFIFRLPDISHLTQVISSPKLHHYSNTDVIRSISPRQFYDVVSDVNSYKTFVPYCTSSRIIDGSRRLMNREEGEVLQQSFKGVLGVGFKNSEGRYTSSVTCIENHRLNRYEVIAVASESEVFKQLKTRWTIMPLDANSSTDDACRVQFVIDYQFKSVLHDAMAGFFFNEVALKMVDAFKVEAHSRMKRLQK
ncbi:hypothetical protein MIR68_008861 [Amoeboaphelidium protococcarum]|nr:hypothetical protein MIR68_008861 [Amoeboaphelidium protococcarum]